MRLSAFCFWDQISHRFSLFVGSKDMSILFPFNLSAPKRFAFNWGYTTFFNRRRVVFLSTVVGLLSLQILPKVSPLAISITAIWFWKQFFLYKSVWWLRSLLAMDCLVHNYKEWFLISRPFGDCGGRFSGYLNQHFSGVWFLILQWGASLFFLIVGSQIIVALSTLIFSMPPFWWTIMLTPAVGLTEGIVKVIAFLTEVKLRSVVLPYSS